MARTVLVADDSPTIQKKAQGILKGEGYEVETVSNGVAAIKKIPKILPILVLADVSMPGKDGYEVCDFIKNSSEFQHIPVVLVASDLEPYDESRGARVRADGKVKKPFEPEALISLVSRFAAQSAAAATKAAPAPTVITAPPPEFAVSEPMDAETEYGRKPAAISGLAEGVAFAVPAAEEVPPPAAPEAMAVPMVEEVPPPPVVPEAITAPAMEPLPDTEVPAPPALEAGAAAAAAVAMDETPIAAEPVLVEETPPPAPEPTPEAEETMMFEPPADVAPPVLNDAAVASAVEVPGVEAPPAEVPPVEPPPVETAPPPEAPPVAASNLDSFSLTDAATGQVRIAPPPEEVAAVTAEPEPVSVPESVQVPEPEPVAAAEPAPVAVPATPAIDPQLVFTIVQRAVVKMAPPALSPATVEEMARKLADEIYSDLSADTSRTP